MIVEPNLLDHPKFLRLARRLGTGTALIVLIRIWAHCQAECRGEFWPGADAEYVEAVARWDGDPGIAFGSLRELGWITVEDRGVRIHDWNSVNASLIQRWMAGPKGGRPRGSGNRPVNRPDNRDHQNEGVPDNRPVNRDGVNEAESETGRLTGVESPGPSEGQNESPETGRLTETGVPDNRPVNRSDNRDPGFEASRLTGRPPEKKREEEKREECAPRARAHEAVAEFAEAPSIGEASAFAATFPGEMASGTPGPIDPGWVSGWWEWRDNHRNAGWATMLDWRRTMVSDWRRQWREYRRRAAVAEPAAAGQVVPLGIRIRELEALARDHIGNPENTRGSLDAKRAASGEYRKLRREIRELRTQLVDFAGSLTSENAAPAGGRAG